MKRWTAMLGILLMCVGFVGLAAEEQSRQAAPPKQGKTEKQEQEDLPPWRWSPETVRQAVNQVRAGKDLTPREWPRGTRVAVALSFDFDAETNALRDNQLSPGVLSQGEYTARTAIPRILNLLDRYKLPATFFVPAVTALLHPKEIAAIQASGRHELGMHGWIHERNSLLGEDEERRLMRKSYELLKSVTGRHPDAVLGLQPGHGSAHPRAGVALRQQSHGRRPSL